ncbi:MAG: gamma-glutamylcyclotransferase [Elainellaceae cyanobacterium]
MAPLSPDLDLLRVFVYGTLKPGECNYAHYCARKVIHQQEAIAQGTLYDLPLGYPAMVEGSGEVRGCLLCFGDRTFLRYLDDLEDYEPGRPLQENEYIRRRMPVFDLNRQPLGDAWVYLMAPERIRLLNGVLVRDGCWTGK